MTTNKNNLSKIVATIVTLVLWVITVALGACAIWALLETITLVILSLPLFGIMQDRIVSLSGTAVAVRWGVVVLGGIAWIIITIGGFDYHFKRVGQPESWRLFAWTIGLELALIAPLFLLNLILWFDLFSA